MGKLNIGVEIRDFDLERMGFSLSVLDETKERQSSEAYLRMTLTQLSAFLGALKAAPDEIELSTVESMGGRGMQGLATEAPVQRNAPRRTEGKSRADEGRDAADDHGGVPRDLQQDLEADISIRELRSMARGRSV